MKKPHYPAHNRAVPGSNPGGPTKLLPLQGKEISQGRDSPIRRVISLSEILKLSAAICRSCLGQVSPLFARGGHFLNGESTKTLNPHSQFCFSGNSTIYRVPFPKELFTKIFPL